MSTSRARSVSLRDVNFAPNFEIRKFRGSNSNDIFVVRLFASRRQSLPRQSSAKPFWPWFKPQALRVRHPIVARDRLARRPHGPKTFRVLEKKKSECPQVVVSSLGQHNFFVVLLDVACATTSSIKSRHNRASTICRGASWRSRLTSTISRVGVGRVALPIASGSTIPFIWDDDLFVCLRRLHSQPVMLALCSMP